MQIFFNQQKGNECFCILTFIYIILDKSNDNLMIFFIN
jgi:hypothetical protein